MTSSRQLPSFSVQGTLKNLLQYHSSEASILLHSALFMAQLSHPYMTSGKTIALTRWTFVGKVMSLLFYYAVYVSHNFSSKEQQSFNILAVVTIYSDFGAQENKICHGFHFFSLMCLPWNDGSDAMIFIFWMFSFKLTFQSPLWALSRYSLVPLTFCH